MDIVGYLGETEMHQTLAGNPSTTFETYDDWMLLQTAGFIWRISVLC